MSSTSDFAPQAETLATPGDAGDPASVAGNGDLADLHREAAAALRALGDKYEAESKDALDRAGKLKAELEATEAIARKLAGEAEQIRAEADRVGQKPDWLNGAPAQAPVEPAHSDPAATEPGPAVVESTDTTADPPAAPAPGPGPARGFAPGASPTTEPVSPSPISSGEVGATPAQTTDGAGEAEDWAPRPFESWRNQTKQVTPKILEL